MRRHWEPIAWVGLAVIVAGAFLIRDHPFLGAGGLLCGLGIIAYALREV